MVSDGRVTVAVIADNDHGDPHTPFRLSSQSNLVATVGLDDMKLRKIGRVLTRMLKCMVVSMMQHPWVKFDLSNTAKIIEINSIFTITATDLS